MKLLGPLLFRSLWLTLGDPLLVLKCHYILEKNTHTSDLEGMDSKDVLVSGSTPPPPQSVTSVLGCS